MKLTLRFSCLLLLLGYHLKISAQKMDYSNSETEAIRDSIHKTRWDIGGRPSHYSFRFMSEFFPVAVIYKPEQPYPFRSKPHKGFEQIIVKSKNDSLPFEAYLNKLHFTSFIVLHKGEIVYEKYFTMRPQEKHTLQSVTKVVTSLILMRLVNDKKLDITKTIDQYIPELASSEWKGISVRDILNMRSGMEGSEMDFTTGPFTNPKNPHYKFEAALGILPKTAETPASVFQFFTTLKRVSAPGSKAEYNSGNTFVLGWLAEKITGKKYADLVTEMIWKPMGASADAYVCLSDSGVPWAHGGMSATLRDLARFGMLFTKSEIIANKERLVSFAQLKEIFATPATRTQMGPFTWGYQWDLAYKGTMMKSGFGGQALYVDPERELVIACYNYVDIGWETMNMISEEAYNEIVKVIDAKK